VVGEEPVCTNLWERKMKMRERKAFGINSKKDCRVGYKLRKKTEEAFSTVGNRYGPFWLAHNV